MDGCLEKGAVEMKRNVQIGAFFLTVASAAFGQGYSPAVRSNVLDASRQLGSGGYNSPAPRYGYGGGFGNLYITGNVTGGRGFRGYVPYSDPTQFSSRLGSSALSGFEGDATHLRRVEAGIMPGQTMPYYHGSSTILPLSAHAQGLTLPGSLIPRAQVLPRSESFGTRAFLSPYTTEGFVRLPENVRTSDVLVPNITLPQQLPVQPGEMAGISPTPTPAERTLPFGQEPKAQPTPEQPESLLGQPTPMPEPGQPQEVQQDYSSWLNAQAEQAERPQIKVGFQPEFAEQARQMGTQGHLSKMTESPTTEQVTPTPTPMSTPSPTMSPLPESQRLRRPSAIKSGQPVVSTLAGNGDDTFSQVMRLGQRLLSQGKFYGAHQAYVQAGSLKENDPMPLFGQAHALIGAGDLRSGAVALEAALKQFPKFLRLQLDGARLIGSASILNRRREQLENLAAKNDDPQIKLLFGYLEVLSGRREAGLQQIAQSGLVAVQ